MKRSKKHRKLIKDYDKQKRKHLDKLASKMVDAADKNSLLKNKVINQDFLDLF
tara:strand:+ start:165 stop:323 length:159 start_codon:yes stop_codon:yes gene_type:complete